MHTYIFIASLVFSVDLDGVGAVPVHEACVACWFFCMPEALCGIRRMPSGTAARRVCVWARAFLSCVLSFSSYIAVLVRLQLSQAAIWVNCTAPRQPIAQKFFMRQKKLLISVPRRSVFCGAAVWGFRAVLIRVAAVLVLGCGWCRISVGARRHLRHRLAPISCRSGAAFWARNLAQILGLKIVPHFYSFV